MRDEEDETEPENLPLMQDAVAALNPEQEENTRNENGHETTEIILEDQQAELKIEHNPITIDMDLHSDEQPDAESPGDLEVITAGNSSIIKQSFLQMTAKWGRLAKQEK